ncbi:MAG: hypothetical protein V1821_00605 [bacterium]
MSDQIQRCHGCHNEYTVSEGDQNFYERLNSPAPRYCPSCRMHRRIVFRNERTLYQRKCDLCQKTMVAIYPSGTSFPVYCSPCWNGDGWDPKSFGQIYDPARPFFDQIKELQSRVPRVGLVSLTSVNSEYTNNSADNKNCYLLFASENCEDVMYGRLLQRCKFVLDAAFLYDSELCYECVDCRQCYNCLFSERCQTSNDLLFCFDALDSKNCIFSTNLRHAEYLIENRQCSKEEYEAKRKEILSSYENLEAAKIHFNELKAQALVKFAFQTKCEDATGDYLFNCHHSNLMFDSSNAVNSSYMADAEDPIDCLDGNNMYYKSELCIDVMGSLKAYRSKYSCYAFYCTDVEYCDNCHNSDDCFGCISLRKCKNCILNKEYSSEEYKKIKQQIIASLTKEGLYGDFFPPAISPFGHNETLAQDYYPLTRETALATGFRWQDLTTGTRGKETMKPETMPKNISEVTDEIVNQVLLCTKCNRNFRILPAELAFYRKMGLPLPRQDFECRHQARVNMRTPRQLWHRQCMCDYATRTNTAKHTHHETGRCNNKFETAYAPDRPEVIYCESCYQSEVV